MECTNQHERSTPFDPAVKFVRVTRVRADGLVEFDFAVGEPDLFVEMILPPQEFADFCISSRATLLERNDSAQPPEDWQWRLRDAMRKRLGS